MKSNRKIPALRKLLDVCDDLQQIRSKLEDPELEREARTRLRRQSKRKTEQLTRNLESCTFRGPLAQIMKSFPLTPDHFQILSVLLHRQMCCEDPALEGRLILASIFECTYEVLSRIDLLRQDCPLRETGLMVPEDAEENPEDLLGARFTLSENGVDCFRQEITGKPMGETRGPGRHDPYESNGEFLVDLRIIHNLYQLRSTRVFAVDRWNRLHNATFQPGRDLNQRIRRCWERVRDRLGSTPDSGTFPAVRLMREYNLREKEMVCVIHLLFRELYEGNAYDDVAELLKLISRTEDELIQNRRFLMDHSCLIKRELISIEPFLDGRTLTGEAYLNDWVVNYLFGSTTTDENIKDDERIDWHMYLAELDDTQGFFHDLGTN